MEQINYYLSKLLSWIDNGRFFIDPMKWIYMVFAYLSFVPPIIVFWFFYTLSDEGFFKPMSGWTKFTAYLFFFVFCIIVVFAAILMYYFWKNRCKKINHAVKVGDQIVALPLWAHWNQSLGESIGVYIGVVPPIAGVLIYLWGLITGFDYLKYFGDNILQTIILSLIVLAVFIAIHILIGFGIVLISHFISESIKLRAQIANDVRDLGDIHRAATMQNVEPAKEEETEE